MVKVSVIVPVYNLEKYLRRCMDSLVNQTLEDIQIIAVDDASPDHSIDILNEYKKKYPKKITVIQSRENLRQGGARNIGLKAAKGVYIGFVDNDDWVDLTMYEKLYNEAILTDSDIVDCDIFEATEEKTFEPVVSNLPEQIGLLDSPKKKSLIVETGRMFSKIFRRSLFIDHAISFPEKISYDDNEVMPILMACAKSLGKINEGLYYYFISGISTTRSRNNKLCFDRMITSINMVEHFKRRNLYDSFKDEVDYRFLRIYYANSILVFINKFDPPQKEFLGQIRDYMKENYPGYRKNIYFISRENTWYKIITKANDIAPGVAILLNSLSRMALRVIPRQMEKKVRKGIL